MEHTGLKLTHRGMTMLAMVIAVPSTISDCRCEEVPIQAHRQR